jgi:hypothetical protein
MKEIRTHVDGEYSFVEEKVAEVGQSITRGVTVRAYSYFRKPCPKWKQATQKIQKFKK